MAVSDSIADFLTRVRNGSKALHRFVDVNWSKINQNMADILKSQGFIENYLVKLENDHRGTIRMFLKYTPAREPIIQGIKQMSKPGYRKYVKHDDIPRFYGGLGMSIISTSQGVMPGIEAKKKKIGGELICLVW